MQIFWPATTDADVAIGEQHRIGLDGAFGLEAEPLTFRVHNVVTTSPVRCRRWPRRPA
jgi:glycine cleavage system pyridoxal-binding protein P